MCRRSCAGPSALATQVRVVDRWKSASLYSVLTRTVARSHAEVSRCRSAAGPAKLSELETSIDSILKALLETSEDLIRAALERDPQGPIPSDRVDAIAAKAEGEVLRPALSLASHLAASCQTTPADPCWGNAGFRNDAFANLVYLLTKYLRSKGHLAEDELLFMFRAPAGSFLTPSAQRILRWLRPSDLWSESIAVADF